MQYDCVILPEYIKGNKFNNVRGGKYGCPIDQALYAAQVPVAIGSMGPHCYVSRLNQVIYDQIDAQGIEDQVMLMLEGRKPIEEIKFTITL